MNNTSGIAAVTNEELADLNGRISALKETLEGFVLTAETSWPEITDKLNVLQVRLASLHQNLLQTQKWKTSVIEPYSMLNHAELVPQVYLRSRWLPEKEAEMATYQPPDDIDSEKISAYEKLSEKCCETISDISADFRHNQRYQVSQLDADFDRLAKDEQNHLTLLSGFIRTGKQ